MHVHTATVTLTLARLLDCYFPRRCQTVVGILNIFREPANLAPFTWKSRLIWLPNGSSFKMLKNRPRIMNKCANLQYNAQTVGYYYVKSWNVRKLLNAKISVDQIDMLSPLFIVSNVRIHPLPNFFVTCLQKTLFRAQQEVVAVCREPNERLFHRCNSVPTFTKKIRSFANDPSLRERKQGALH